MIYRFCIILYPDQIEQKEIFFKKTSKEIMNQKAWR